MSQNQTRIVIGATNSQHPAYEVGVVAPSEVLYLTLRYRITSTSLRNVPRRSSRCGFDYVYPAGAPGVDGLFSAATYGDVGSLVANTACVVQEDICQYRKHQ
jgi:hypothetical protein